MIKDLQYSNQLVIFFHLLFFFLLLILSRAAGGGNNFKNATQSWMLSYKLGAFRKDQTKEKVRKMSQRSDCALKHLFL